jgi:hypothetical protein
MTTTSQVTTTVPPRTRVRAITLTACALLLSACGGGSGSSGSSGTTSTPATATSAEVATLKATIQQLEASGKLPNLDRSSSIAGPDANSNGVRDDIEAYVASLPITPVQKSAAIQHAKVFQQKITVDLNDPAALNRVSNLGSRATNCIGDVFMPAYQDGYELGSKLEAMTANTKERAKQYLAYNRARSGSVSSEPTGNTCDP